jgi:hypothetical protein
MASKTKGFAMQLSEADGDMLFTLALETPTAKDARHIAALVNGLKALLSLLEPGENLPEGILEALSDAHADADGATVKLNLELPRSLIDQARQAIRVEMGPGREGKEEEPPPGARRKRALR